MLLLARATSLCATLLTGAIFGFFYAYFCSAMWGLDASAPAVAIAAMQNINAAVRNLAFMPAFFFTPAALLAAAMLCRLCGAQPGWFLAAALVYGAGGIALTATQNVPMNAALAQVTIPSDPAEARALWEAYSPRWQVWNAVRMAASGVALGLAGMGLMGLGQVRA